MKERPILFCGEMVRAILDGRKTQTRRVVKESAMIEAQGRMMEGEESDWSPYGQVGDRLWVKETFMPMPHINAKAFYRATDPLVGGKWKPSIFMPRKLSRITLEIVSVRVERLQDMTEEDACMEGVEPHPPSRVDNRSYRRPYEILWDRINGKTHPWSSNPWVWRVEFKRL